MTESPYKYKTSCPSCGSSDANALYENGNTHCFSCKKTVFNAPSVGQAVSTGHDLSKLIYGDYQPLPDRGLRIDVLTKYKYQINDTYKDHCNTHIAPYFDETGALIAQHLRFEGDKSCFPWMGSPQNAKTLRMFGQHLFPAGGKKLFICEGEIDAMSVHQTTNFPAVGIAGTDRVEKVIKANLEWIESFDDIVLVFDNDDPGIAACKVALRLISFGKAKYLVDYPDGCNDANDILTLKGPNELGIRLHTRASEYQIDGIKDVKDVRFEPDDFEISLYPWDSFNKQLFARRSGELTVYTSGTGMGKSTILRAIYSSLVQQGEKCAMIMLEESTAETKADLMSCLSGVPIRKILAKLAVNKAFIAKGLAPLFPDVEPLKPEALKNLEQQVDNSGLILVDHSEGYNIESILSQMRFLAVSKGIKHILLDHITLLIASDAEHDNDVKQLDIVMKRIRMLCEETGVSIDMISHIRKRANGAKSVNGGAQIAVEELRGSGSLAQIANNIIAFERDQQAENPNVTICRSLKSRMGGFTGTICNLTYNPDTGQLTETEGGDTGFKDQAKSTY